MATTHAHRGTILFIEDDVSCQRLVRRTLEPEGFRLFSAADGIRGLEVARVSRPDLVMINIRLPAMDGYTVATRLRTMSTTKSVPIVAISSKSSSMEKELALAAGCDGFLSKPLDLRRLPQQITDYLGGRRESITDEVRHQALSLYTRQVVERLESKVTELETANRQLRQLDKMKNDFIVLISHELRTPVNLITGYVHLLESMSSGNEMQVERAEVASYVEGMQDAVSRLSDLITEVISVSNIAGGVLDVFYQPFHLSKIVAPVLHEAREALEERNLHVVVDGLEALPEMEGDVSQLKVAFANLLSNAIKFTPDGGQINIDVQIVSDLAHIQVRDSGIGIPPDEQYRIFEHFYALNEIEHHTTSKFAFMGGGLGIGLAITKGIIEAHGGRISVDSRGEDRENLPGTTFHVFLPVNRHHRLS